LEKRATKCLIETTRRSWRDRFVPPLHVELTEDPTKGNALRVKGGGEAGITPSSAALVNAVIDALSDFGIEHIDMPATPERVWRAIRDVHARSTPPPGR
jgi:carbon-monoxide dehydrogenase large subunit